MRGRRCQLRLEHENAGSAQSQCPIELIHATPAQGDLRLASLLPPHRGGSPGPEKELLAVLHKTRQNQSNGKKNGTAPWGDGAVVVNYRATIAVPDRCVHRWRHATPSRRPHERGVRHERQRHGPLRLAAAPGRHGLAGHVGPRARSAPREVQALCAVANHISSPVDPRYWRRQARWVSLDRAALSAVGRPGELRL